MDTTTRAAGSVADTELCKNMLDWAVRYVKHKDILKRAIQSVAAQADACSAIVTTKTGEERIMVEPSLAETGRLFAALDVVKEKPLLLVVLNTKKNLDALIAQWKRFSSYKTLKMVFYNPHHSANAAGEQKWVLVPHTHNNIADLASLKTGLSSMAESVPFVE